MKAWNNFLFQNFKQPALSLYHAQKHLPQTFKKIHDHG